MKTERLELVETDQLYKSIMRLRKPSNYNWQRALYHALAMADTERVVLEKIRAALNLP